MPRTVVITGCSTAFGATALAALENTMLVKHTGPESPACELASVGIAVKIIEPGGVTAMDVHPEIPEPATTASG